MKHLNEDELIEIYYGEGASTANTHLKVCRECSKQYAEFKQSLDAIRPTAAPQRGADYGDRIWQALEPRLIPYQKKAAGWRAWAHWRSAALAVGSAMLLAAVFLGGRYWERLAGKNTANGVNNPEATRPVVLVVVTDHLERTERLLVGLEHADAPDDTESAQLQLEARELLASNRLYRVTASNAGDPALAGALDRLEGVLAEVANNPNLTAADLERVRKDMNTRGILFEVRVLLARKPDQGSGPKPAKGVSI
jgi:hypothetical protein